MIQIWSFCAGRKPSHGGFFAYVCIEKFAFVDYLRTAQKSIKYRIGVCALIRTRLLVIWIISAHGCILRTYSDIPNNDFGLQRGSGWGVWYSLFIKNLAHYSSHENFGVIH